MSAVLNQTKKVELNVSHIRFAYMAWCVDGAEPNQYSFADFAESLVVGAKGEMITPQLLANGVNWAEVGGALTRDEFEVVQFLIGWFNRMVSEQSAVPMDYHPEPMRAFVKSVLYFAGMMHNNAAVLYYTIDWTKT